MIEKKLFRVACNLTVYPVFYVEAVDIVDAVKKSKEIVNFYNPDKVVVTVSTIDIPLLDLKIEVGSIT